jgi:hypothetical protein
MFLLIAAARILRPIESPFPSADIYHIFSNFAGCNKRCASVCGLNPRIGNLFDWIERSGYFPMTCGEFRGA